MTDIWPEACVCDVCGGESIQDVLISTNAFGSPDLDLRPPPMKRHTMSLWLQECPHCLFVSRQISSATMSERRAFEDPGYLDPEAAPEASDLALRFLRRAFIEERCSDPRRAGEAVLHAAWVLDDEGLDAQALRLRGAALLAEALAAPDLDEAVREDMTLRRIDMLRRAGAFADAVAVAGSFLDGPIVEPAAATIARFQRIVALEGNTETFPIDEAQERMEGSAEQPSADGPSHG